MWKEKLAGHYCIIIQAAALLLSSKTTYLKLSLGEVSVSFYSFQSLSNCLG